MSLTTDVLLMTIDEEGTVEYLNAWLHQHAEGQQLKPLNTLAAGGKKTFGCDVWAMCANYLPTVAFVEFFGTLRWDIPDSVVLLLDGDTEDETRVIRPKGADRG